MADYEFGQDTSTPDEEAFLTELRRVRQQSGLEAPPEGQQLPPVGTSPLARDLEQSGWFDQQEAAHGAQIDRELQDAIARSQASAPPPPARKGSIQRSSPVEAPPPPPSVTPPSQSGADTFTMGDMVTGGTYEDLARAGTQLPVLGRAFFRPQLSEEEAQQAGAEELATAERWAPIWRGLANLIPDSYRSDPDTQRRFAEVGQAFLQYDQTGKGEDRDRALQLAQEFERTQPWGWRLLRPLHSLLNASANEAEARVERARRMMRGELPLPSLIEERHLFDTGARTLAQLFTSDWLQFAGIVQGHAQEALGLGAADDTTLYHFGQTVEEWIKNQFPGDPARQFEFSTQLAQGVASTSAFIGQGGIAGLLRLGRVGQLAVIGLSGAAMQVPDEFERVTAAMREGNASARDRAWVTFWNTIAGLSEAAPFIWNFAGPRARGLTGMLAKGAEQATEEFLQETTQQIIQGTARTIYDPNQDPYEGALQGGIIGLITGGLYGAGMHPHEARASYQAAIRRGETLGFQLASRGGGGVRSVTPPGAAGAQPVPPTAVPPPGQEAPPTAAPAPAPRYPPDAMGMWLAGTSVVDTEGTP